MSNNLPARKFTPNELVSWKQAIFDIYDRMRSKSDIPYDITYGGLDFTVFPSVYAPEFFDDTRWYAEQLRDIVGQKSLLEIGTGTGVIAIFSALNGATVTATDINPTAVKNAQVNAQKHNVALTVFESDVYNSLPANKKYDYIFWAHPFNSWDIDTHDPLLLTGIDPEYKSLKKYIQQAENYLTATGTLLLGTGDSADLTMIEKLAQEGGYKLHLLIQHKQPLEPGQDKQIIDLIYEFKKQNSN